MKRKIVLGLFAVILACAAVFAGYKVWTILAEYRAGEDTYEQMTQFIVATPAPKPVSDVKEPAQTDQAVEETSEPMPTPVEDDRFPVVDFDALKAVSEDIVGWVAIEGTRVNYPVVRGIDNEYYLKRMIDGKRNSAGSIFMDYRNAPDFTDVNTVLYGHNMNNGSMFADIREYRSQEFYDEHPTLMVMTPDGNHLYEVVAGYVASVDMPAWQIEFESDEDVMKWAQKALKRSDFVSTVELKPGDRYLTLSTCTYERDNARYVLVAVEHLTTD